MTGYEILRPIRKVKHEFVFHMFCVMMLYVSLRGEQMPTLYAAFKGNGNSANKIVRGLDGDKLFLTNSYGGLKKDIDNVNDTYDLGNTPTQSLCNEAYWYMLKKCNCHVLFFHVPSIKYITEDFIAKISAVLC